MVFEPGSRNNLHTYPARQTLLVTDGEGFYQERSKPARLLSKRDVVVIPSKSEHWHGATKCSSFTYIVITNITSKGTVKCLEPVNDNNVNTAMLQIVLSKMNE